MLATYLATCIDHRHLLAPGEFAELALIAQNTVKAQKIFDYIRGIFQTVPYLNRLVDGVSAGMIRLKSRIDIAVSASSFRGLRGGTMVGCVADELAFWRSDEWSQNPDREILDAVRPSLLTTRGMLAGLSSPYARRGVLYSVFCKHHGPDGAPHIIVAKAPSLRMNDTIDPADIEAAYADDPVSARAEYGAEFRSDVELFADLETVMKAVDRDVSERPPRYSVGYRGFVDMSLGGSDSHALAIAHGEGEKTVLDYVSEYRRGEGSPDEVTREFAKDLQRYGLSRALSDRVGLEWVKQRFALSGVTIETSADPKAIIYGNFLPMLNSGRVSLLDNKRLISQLVGLERFSGSGGRDRIDHGPGAHDDLINAAAGVLTLASKPRLTCHTSFCAGMT